MLLVMIPLQILYFVFATGRYEIIILGYLSRKASTGIASRDAKWDLGCSEVSLWLALIHDVLDLVVVTFV